MENRNSKPTKASYVRRKRSYYQWLLLGGHLHVLKVLGCLGGTSPAIYRGFKLMSMENHGWKTENLGAK